MVAKVLAFKQAHLTLLAGMVYEKALSLRDLGKYTVGELVNICSNDSQRVFDSGIALRTLLCQPCCGLV